MREGNNIHQRSWWKKNQQFGCMLSWLDLQSHNSRVLSIDCVGLCGVVWLCAFSLSPIETLLFTLLSLRLILCCWILVLACCCTCLMLSVYVDLFLLSLCTCLPSTCKSIVSIKVSECVLGLEGHWPLSDSLLDLWTLPWPLCVPAEPLSVHYCFFFFFFTQLVYQFKSQCLCCYW